MERSRRRSGRSSRPHLLDVRYLDDFRLRISLDNGTEIERDLTPLTERAKGVLTKLRDPKFFRRVRIVDGALTWPGEIDICPLTTLYGADWMTKTEIAKTASI